MIMHFKEDLPDFWDAPVEAMTNENKVVAVLKRNGIETVKNVYDALIKTDGMKNLRNVGAVKAKGIKSAFVDFYLDFLSEEEAIAFFKKAINPMEALSIYEKEVYKPMHQK